MEVSDKCHALAALRYPLTRMLGGLQGQYGRFGGYKSVVETQVHRQTDTLPFIQLRFLETDTKKRIILVSV